MRLFYSEATKSWTELENFSLIKAEELTCSQEGSSQSLERKFSIANIQTLLKSGRSEANGLSKAKKL